VTARSKVRSEARCRPHLSDPKLDRLSSWPGEIIGEDPVTYFTLSDDDMSWLASLNQPENRLGAVVQLSALRRLAPPSTGTLRKTRSHRRSTNSDRLQNRGLPATTRFLPASPPPSAILSLAAATVGRGSTAADATTPSTTIAAAPLTLDYLPPHSGLSKEPDEIQRHPVFG
jgi:Domain of unknown function (DUF4158)